MESASPTPPKRGLTIPAIILGLVCLLAIASAVSLLRYKDMGDNVRYDRLRGERQYKTQFCVENAEAHLACLKQLEAMGDCGIIDDLLSKPEDRCREKKKRKAEACRLTCKRWENRWE